MDNWEVNKPNLSEIPTDSDAISRHAAMETFNRWAEFKDYTHVERHILHAVVDEIRAMPSVAPKQRTGHWILRDDINGQYQCDECGMFSGLSKFDVEEAGWKLSNFCSNCGAKMVEPQESEEQA